MTSTLAFLPVAFEEPRWLLLLLLVVPIFVFGRRSIGGLSRVKATFVFALRVAVVFLLATALAHPIWEKRGEGLTATVILDRSASVPLPLKRESLDFMRDAAALKENREDRVAVITVARDASIAAMPDPYSEVMIGQDVGDLNATNLASAIRLALAIAPQDTANRFILVSDGVETVDNVLEAAEIARANNIRIDALLLSYEHENEVVFDRIVAPARARQGQRANLKLVLRSQTETSGRVHLSVNDETVDLVDGPETDLAVALESGSNVIQIPVGLNQSGPHRFEAVFTPDDPATDAINRNNKAVAVTFVAGQGKILVLDESGAESSQLVRALDESQLDVEVTGSAGLADDLVSLSAYDAIILANVPRYAFTDEQDRMLHAYVHDLGGGLVMLGGPESFGAGGWIDSQVAHTLPVKLDPPQTRQMPRGALALIMHSCEMPQGNFWGQKVAESAIKALSRLDYVGIVEFNWQAKPGVPNLQGCSWALPMQIAGDKVAALAATKTMVVGDMPAFDPSLELAYRGLMVVNAGQRHAIVISDGDPQTPSKTVINKFKKSKITCTTIMVGGHGTAIDKSKMNAIATETGGRFYNIQNPKNLPQIFIKEAQLVSRSLIQEGDIYEPQVVSRLPGPVEGFTQVPTIEGYILTAERDGLTQTPIVIGTKEGNDPIFSHWNFGLGRSIAYTSDLMGRWGSAWTSWARFKAFWEQSIRWVMRPSSPSNLLVETRLEGDRAIVEVEALDSDAAFLNFLRMRAIVLGPTHDAIDLVLQQTGPGRYRGEFRVSDAGAYLINVNYTGGTAAEPVKGNIQAAVNVPYSREFRSTRHNRATLEALTSMTGGRMLEASDPQLADLFDREGLPVPKSPRPIWDLLAIIAAALFLMDVAARRFSIDPEWVAEVFGRAVGRRTEVSTETVSAWKRARGQVAHRRDDTTRGRRKLAEDRSVRFEADESDRDLAIDVGEETTSPTGPSEPRPATPRRREPAAEIEDDESHTSRLLRAKRRALGDETEGKEGEDA